MPADGKVDRLAAGLSFACIVHCLLLPFAAAALPFLAAIASAEWLHWAFASLAIATSASILVLAPGARTPSFMVPSGLGLLLIGGALLAKPWGIYETAPTVAGGLLLAWAHLRRIRRHRILGKL